MRPEQLEKVVSLALDMHITGHDEKDVREMDLDGEYSEQDLAEAFEVRMIFMTRDQELQTLVYNWVRSLIEETT